MYYSPSNVHTAMNYLYYSRGTVHTGIGYYMQYKQRCTAHGSRLNVKGDSSELPH